MTAKTMVSTEDIALKPLRKGKVRDIFDLGDRMVIIASDRLSAFDVVLPDPIPYKGVVLTQLTRFWNQLLKQVITTHLISFSVADLPAEFSRHADTLGLRTMICRKAQVVPIECVVRGYITGSGLKEYQKNGTVCGIKLPKGLREADRLPEPIFSPSTKAEVGHDENISFEQAVGIVGKVVATTIKEKSLALYQKAQEYAARKGIIIADTKFEFGTDANGEIILIDEFLTPDSSRFWPADKYVPGKSQPSFDKQFVRDYLESIKWDKKPPAPALPPEVIDITSKKYLEIFRLLTGKGLPKS